MWVFLTVAGLHWHLRLSHRTSRFVHTSTRSSAKTASLQYIIELAAAGYENISAARGSLAERRDQLDKHTRALNTNKWTTSRSSTPGGDIWHSFEQGVIVTANQEERWVNFLQLPSLLQGTPERSWRVQDIEFRIMDYTVNFDQCLLALVQDRDRPG